MSAASRYWVGPTIRGLMVNALRWRVPRDQLSLRLSIRFPLVEGRMIGESIMYLRDNSGIGLRWTDNESVEGAGVAVDGAEAQPTRPAHTERR